MKLKNETILESCHEKVSRVKSSPRLIDKHVHRVAYYTDILYTV